MNPLLKSLGIFIIYILFAFMLRANEDTTRNALYTTTNLQQSSEPFADMYTFTASNGSKVYFKVAAVGKSLKFTLTDKGGTANTTARYLAKQIVGTYEWYTPLNGYRSSKKEGMEYVVITRHNMALSPHIYDIYPAEGGKPAVRTKKTYLGQLFPYTAPAESAQTKAPTNLKDITGKYRYELTRKVSADHLRGFATGVDISSVADQIMVDINDLKAENQDFLTNVAEHQRNVHESRSAEAKKYLAGTFQYDSNTGFYSSTKTEGFGFIDLAPKSNGDIVVRYRLQKTDKGYEEGILRKEKKSLTTLFSAEKPDVSGITGNDWKIEGTSLNLSLTTAVGNDLNARINGELFKLDKSTGGAFEKYYGTNQEGSEMTMEVINTNKIKLELDGVTKTLSRNGGQGSTRTLSASGTNYSQNNSFAGSTGGSASSSASGMNQILFKAVNAASSNDIDTAIGEGADINATDANGNSILHQAVQKNDEELVRHIISIGADVNRSNHQSKTPLDLAIQKSTQANADMAIQLIDNGATITYHSAKQALGKNNDELISKVISNGDKTHITSAIIDSGNLQMFEKLVTENGVFVSKTMFTQAISKRQLPIAASMIEMGYNPNDALAQSIAANLGDLVFAAVEAGGTPSQGLAYALDTNDEQLIDLSLRKGADPNGHIESLATKGKDAQLSLLLEAGADPNKGIVPAVNAKKLKTLVLLLEKGANPDVGIVNAAKMGQLKMVEVLMEAGADGELLMPVAINNNNTAMVTAALAGGADGTKATYIKTASGLGSAPIVSLLLETGANANDGTEQAVANNKEAILALLLDNGADGSDATLLALSTKHNNTTLTGLLLEAGAPAQEGVQDAVNHTADLVLQQLIDQGADAAKQSYLTTVVVKNNTACTKILLQLGLSAKGENTGALTYLHHAAKNNNSELARLLIDKGAEANAVAQGSTPLHYAVRTRNAVNMVQLLIGAGADVNATNAKGKTVLKLNKGGKTKKILKANGAVK